MCNAAYHSPSCDCGFGGDTGGGGWHWGSVANFTQHYSAPSFGWARRFLLWDLDDPSGARPYLEAAFQRGNSEAAIDLAAIALFGV